MHQYRNFWNVQFKERWETERSVIRTEVFTSSGQNSLKAVHRRLQTRKGTLRVPIRLYLFLSHSCWSRVWTGNKTFVRLRSNHRPFWTTILRPLQHLVILLQVLVIITCVRTCRVSLRRRYVIAYELMHYRYNFPWIPHL